MTALNNLIQFAARLDGELLADFQQRVNAYMDERDRLQNERLATLQATTGTFDVVAIAGTAEQLLTDVINVGDVVYLSDTNITNKGDWQRMNEDDINENQTYKVERIEDRFGVPHLVFYGAQYMHPASNFSKVSTPIVNPHQTVLGC